MNWGAFAGAAAESGVKTYERAEDIKFKQLQRSQLEKEIAEKEALDRAYANSQARIGQQDDYSQAIKTGAGVGTQQAQALSNQGALTGNTAEDQAFEREAAASAVGAMRENAAYKQAGKYDFEAPAEGVRKPQAALPEMKSSEYTADQGMKDYVKAASQISRKGTLEAIQMKGVMRESEMQDKFDTEKKKFDDTLARIQGTAETGGLKGLYDAGTKEGLKLGFVEGKNGIGSRIQVLGPKGDVLETISDVGTATQKLSDAAMQQFMTKSVGLLGSPDKVISYMQQRETLRLREKEVGIKEEEVRDKKPYFAAVAGRVSEETSGLKENAANKKVVAAILDEYAALPVEKQNGREGQALLRKAELATASKSGDVSRIAAGTPMGRTQALYETAVKEAVKIGEKVPDQTVFFAGQGFAPSELMQGEQAKVQQLVNSGKIKEAQILVKKFNGAFKNTPIELPTATRALPVPR